MTVTVTDRNALSAPDFIQKHSWDAMRLRALAIHLDCLFDCPTMRDTGLVTDILNEMKMLLREFTWPLPLK